MPPPRLPPGKAKEVLDKALSRSALSIVFDKFLMARRPADTDGVYSRFGMELHRIPTLAMINGGDGHVASLGEKHPSFRQSFDMFEVGEVKLGRIFDTGEKRRAFARFGQRHGQSSGHRRLRNGNDLGPMETTK